MAVFTGSGPIPADAGEPCAAKTVVFLERAYPRGRGGACSALQPSRVPPGLSPRTRGSPGVAALPGSATGPIPADAGEPLICTGLSHGNRAYPRGRGGARAVHCRLPVVVGLSPRTRGSHAPGCSSTRPSRPIPADAGEPRSTRPRCRPTWAYPRGRGGAFRSPSGFALDSGLSPRTRGSRALPRRWRQTQGPIPADAGEPTA